jgi:hypothetical protein
MKTWIKKHKGFVFVFVLFLIGILVRILFLPQLLFFGFEQGRDAEIAQAIYTFQKLPLIGPKTDISGIFHGAGYYYFIAALYALTGGSPYYVIIVFAVINAAGVFFVYRTMKLMSSNQAAPLIASLLYIFSFNTILYARWLSNVSPSIFLTALFVYSLVLYIRKNTIVRALLLGGVTGLFLHFEILHGLYAFFAICALILARKVRFTPKTVLAWFAVCVILASPFILFELRHDFLMMRSAIGYLQKPNEGTHGNVWVYISGLLYEINQTFSPMNLYGLLTPLSALIILGTVIYTFIRPYWTSHEKTWGIVCSILIFWSIPYIFLIKDFPLVHYYAGTAIPLILLFSLAIASIPLPYRRIVYLLGGLIIVCNTAYGIFYLRNTFHVFYHSTQREMHYKDQLNAMDFIFTYSNDPFHYDVFTVPYFSKNAWDYLYTWLGKNTYFEKFNLNNKMSDLSKKKYFFLVIEPGSKSGFLNTWIHEYDVKTKLITERTFGAIRVQVRSNNLYR